MLSTPNRAVSPITKEEKHSTLSLIIVICRLCPHFDTPTGPHIQIVTQIYSTSSLQISQTILIQISVISVISPVTTPL
jgi:hypothetical protein